MRCFPTSVCCTITFNWYNNWLLCLLHTWVFVIASNVWLDSNRFRCNYVQPTRHANDNLDQFVEAAWLSARIPRYKCSFKFNYRHFQSRIEIFSITCQTYFLLGYNEFKYFDLILLFFTFYWKIILDTLLSFSIVNDLVFFLIDCILVGSLFKLIHFFFLFIIYFYFFQWKIL